MQYWPPESIADTMSTWHPGEDLINEQLEAFRGGFAAQMVHRIPFAIKFQTFVFLVWSGWRAGGLMLIGMALYKWGVLTAERSAAFYQRSAAIGFLIGLPPVIIGMIKHLEHNFSLEYSMFLGSQFNYWGSLAVAYGYISLIMLICKHNLLSTITSRLAAVGRLALSNYLLQTVICTLLFYGHGLGLFGSVERRLQLLTVFAIWTIQIVLSSIWLQYFRFGPAEWLWRSLTYMKLQPFRTDRH